MHPRLSSNTCWQALGRILKVLGAGRFLEVLGGLRNLQAIETSKCLQGDGISTVSPLPPGPPEQLSGVAVVIIIAVRTPVKFRELRRPLNVDDF